LTLFCAISGASAQTVILPSAWPRVMSLRACAMPMSVSSAALAFAMTSPPR